MRLKNKTALITGGGRGLGKAIALRFAEEGADIAICSRSLKELKEVAAEIEKLNRRVLVLKVDISEERQVKKFIGSALKKFGQIDILVNNAGITGPNKTILDMTYTEWVKTINVNLNGTFLCSKVVLPRMIKKKYGKIINISSVAGKKGGSHLSAYCASKAAMISLTQSIAAETGRMGVYSNVICPGAIETQMLKEGLTDLAGKMGLPNPEPITAHFLQMTPLGRLATEAEVANTALFLASDESSGITGETFTVSAGALTY